MALNFKKFYEGIRIFPKATSNVSVAGELDYDSANNKLNLHNGTTSSPVTTEAHSATLTNKKLSDSTTEVVDVSDNTKKIKFDAGGTTGTSTTITGAQTANRVLTLPDATTTLVGTDNTATLTNKTFDAEGTGNTLSNVKVTNLKSGVLDTDLNAVSASDDTLASAKAIKTYVDAQVATTSGAATQANLDAHIADTIDAHDASAISVTGFTQTDVQSLLTAEFNTATGHDHDGTDSKKLLATNLLSTGETVKKFLAADGSGNSSWAFLDTAVSSITGNTTLTASNTVVPVDATSGVITITLPSATGLNGKKFIIKKTDSSFNAVTVAGTIDGVTNTTLNTQNECVEIVCNGTNYYVIQRYIPSVWTNYSNNGGAISSNVSLSFGGAGFDLWYRRSGDSIFLKGYIGTDVPAASVAYAYYPEGITANLSKMPSGNNPAGTLARGISTASTEKFFVVIPASDRVYFSRWSYTAADSPFGADNASSMFGTAETLLFEAGPIPVTGWNG